MNPLFIFALIFIAMPLMEIYLLIEVGSVIGALPTILITIFTAVSGIALIRVQGLQTIQKIQQARRQMESPAIRLIEGMLLLIAAFLLLVPGFASDSLGFLLLIPPLRYYIARRYLAQINLASPTSTTHQFTYIEGEYEEIHEKTESIEKK